MPVYRTQMHSWYSSGEDIGPWDCEVRLDGDSIVVSYDEEGESVIYRGREIAPGCFRLTCRDRDATASLYRAAGGILEGGWVEYGYEGRWRIPLTAD